MPLDQLPPYNPNEWIEYAEGDLVFARLRIKPQSKTQLKYCCYHAHQAAEKALKALVIARGMKFKYIHSLQALLADLKEDGAEIPPMVERVRDLDSYGVDARYPSQGESSEEFHPEEAAEKAGIALEWAKKEIARTQSGAAIR